VWVWCQDMVVMSTLPLVLLAVVMLLLNGGVFGAMPAAGGRMIRVRKDGDTGQQCLTSTDCGSDECCVQPQLGSSESFCSPMRSYGDRCSSQMKDYMGNSEVFIGECPCKPWLACKAFASISFCIPTKDSLQEIPEKRFIQNLPGQG
ncbi:unnamed protein product, partial [Meganyctiphanes norvegica]